MKKAFLLIAFTIISIVKAQSMQDILNIPGPIMFNNQEFFLHWSKPSSKILSIQNFLPRDEHFDNFENLLAFNYFDADIDIEMAVRQKIESAQKLKERDKSAHINMIQSPDSTEFIVEYHYTEYPKTTPAFLEYNLYKFSKLGTEKKPLLITAYTKRFYTNLKEAKKTISKERNFLLEELINLRPTNIKPIRK